MSVVEIKNAVAALPEKDRADLIVWLLDTVSTASSEDEAELDDGVHEAVRRREEFDSGRVAPLSPEEFWAGVDRARSQWKQ